LSRTYLRGGDALPLALADDRSDLLAMLSPTAPDFVESKVNRLVENVVATWSRTTATRGTQMIFADMGVNPTP
jgi:hypothetical protein